MNKSEKVLSLTKAGKMVKVKLFGIGRVVSHRGPNVRVMITKTGGVVEVPKKDIESWK